MKVPTIQNIINRLLSKIEEINKAPQDELTNYQKFQSEGRKVGLHYSILELEDFRNSQDKELKKIYSRLEYAISYYTEKQTILNLKLKEDNRRNRNDFEELKNEYQNIIDFSKIIQQMLLPYLITEEPTKTPPFNNISIINFM